MKRGGPRWEFDLGQGQVVVEVPADLDNSEVYEVEEFFKLIGRSLHRRALDAKAAAEAPVRLSITNDTDAPVQVRLAGEEEEPPHVF